MAEQTRIRKKRNFGNRLDREVDKIVYKIMTNEGLEDTVARAIQRALIDFVKRYFLLVVILVIFALGIQSYFMVILLNNN